MKENSDSMPFTVRQVEPTQLGGRPVPGHIDNPLECVRETRPSEIWREKFSFDSNDGFTCKVSGLAQF